VTKAETTIGAPPFVPYHDICVNCGQRIHGVITSISGGVEEYAWVHSDRRTIFRTQDCIVRDLSAELLP